MTIDDPLLFGLLPFRLAFSPSSLRWGLGASNVCFSKPSHGTFCALAKIIPVHRGDGVYQRGMDLLLDKMNDGDWAHLFPGVYKFEHSPPPGRGGGNKIKGFGDGEENQKFEKKKKENF